jgi:hypothetical protein
VSSHRALVDEFYGRMNAQDLTLTELCSPDLEWHWARPWYADSAESA